MKAQEVWELWQEDKSLRFKNKLNDIVTFDGRIVKLRNFEIALSHFMNSEWEEDYEWVGVTFVVGLIELANGKVVKTVSPDGYHEIVSGDTEFTINNAKQFKWFIKEN